jgi:glycosyltransferase involved in cell wall biosynthesis
LLHACDVFALASHAEGLGVAALEAMAAGRAVVASRVGGLAQAVVEGRTGLCVEPGDVTGFASALERLARDPGLRARLGAEGPARVSEGFEVEQMVAAYERLYREVLRGPVPLARGSI